MSLPLRGKACRARCSADFFGVRHEAVPRLLLCDLQVPIAMPNGAHINWIDSKATFGDETQHRCARSVPHLALLATRSAGTGLYIQRRLMVITGGMHGVTRRLLQTRMLFRTDTGKAA